MSKGITLLAVLLTLLVSFAGLSANTDNDVTIDTFGATPFLHGSSSYLPLQSVASFLGAPVQWDPSRNRAVMAYNGKELSLTPGSRNALFDNRPVVLSAAPVIGQGRLFVPMDALRQTYRVPMEWDQSHSRLRIMGSTGWGAVTVSHRPPGWVHGRKTGWAKHGDAALPPGISQRQGARAVVVVPKTATKSHPIAKSKGLGPRATPTPPKKERAKGGRGQ